MAPKRKMTPEPHAYSFRLNGVNAKIDVKAENYITVHMCKIAPELQLFLKLKWSHRSKLRGCYQLHRRRCHSDWSTRSARRSTRSSMDLLRHASERCARRSRRAFAYAGPPARNKLLPEVKSTSTLETFKTKIRMHSYRVAYTLQITCHSRERM